MLVSDRLIGPGLLQLGLYLGLATSFFGSGWNRPQVPLSSTYTLGFLPLPKLACVCRSIRGPSCSGHLPTPRHRDRRDS